MKRINCKRCGKRINKKGGRQKYCGNQKKKGSCSWLHHGEFFKPGGKFSYAGRGKYHKKYMSKMYKNDPEFKARHLEIMKEYKAKLKELKQSR